MEQVYSSQESRQQIVAEAAGLRKQLWVQMIPQTERKEVIRQLARRNEVRVDSLYFAVKGKYLNRPRNWG